MWWLRRCSRVVAADRAGAAFVTDQHALDVLGLSADDVARLIERERPELDRRSCPNPSKIAAVTAAV
jgi:hypothetical protein